MIIATPRLKIQSTKALRTYLEEDLRIDMYGLGNVDAGIIAPRKVLLFEF